MNIHEYQAKRLLAQFGVSIPGGDVAYTTHEVERIFNWLDSDVAFLKAQVHAGGRGKSGGVQKVASVEEAVSKADAMFGMYLKTPQTDEKGKKVRRIYVEAGCEPKQEFYFCMTQNRATGGSTVMVSAEGGMEIEDLAAKHPNKIKYQELGPGRTLQSHQARRLSYEMGLSGREGRRMQDTLTKIASAFDESDCLFLEVNPLVLTTDGKVQVLDCKATFDDNAMYRHRQIEEMRDEEEIDPLEQEAARHNLNYVKMQGNIGLMVNGAGLSMATMDIISHYGGSAANFMDVAGAATPERVAAAFKLIYHDEDVKGILINIFGGMMRCNSIAEGLVQAASDVGLSKPLVVRLEGTNVEEGRKILAKSDFPIEPCGDMRTAAERIVKAVKERV